MNFLSIFAFYFHSMLNLVSLHFFFLLQNIEFALGQVSSSQNVGSATQHSAKIQEELRNLILKRKARNEEVFEWIDVSIRY